MQYEVHIGVKSVK